MNAGSVLLRMFRIAAIAAPIAAGISYAVLYGTDHWFKLGCREPDPVEGFHLLAIVWLVLAVCQIVGFRARPRWLDAWKIVVIAVSVLGVDACWELYFLPPLWNNCQNIGLYDYADDFLGVDFVLLLCIPVMAVSVVVALVAAIKWQYRRDMEKLSHGG